MNCPHCGAAMHTDRTHADWACACGLAGGRDVLDALAARLAPAGVLAEAERLLRAAGVSEAQFTWTTGLLARDGDAYEPTLAEAYAKLKEGNHG